MSDERPLIPNSHPAPELDLLVVGAGGIGAPLLLGLQSSHLTVGLVDDDIVEKSNLHRQILFSDRDVGRTKLDAAVDASNHLLPTLTIVPFAKRVRPDNALSLVKRSRVVIDASDNFATRFLLADACHLVGRPIVHAAAVQWHATVIAVSAEGAPCYRCLFEEPPAQPALDCATGGVVGPVCGVAGAIAADLALLVLAGRSEPFGFIHTFDGLTDRLRKVSVSARGDCFLCGAAGRVTELDPALYEGSLCEA